MRILIVDDHKDIRMLASLSLSRVGGHEVVAASSGAEACALAREQSFDVVLLDLMMPNMDGAETLLNLRSTPGFERVPILFLTARTDPEQRERCRALGAQGMIEKPFDPMHLPAQVEQRLASGEDPVG